MHAVGVPLCCIIAQLPFNVLSWVPRHQTWSARQQPGLLHAQGCLATVPCRRKLAGPWASTLGPAVEQVL